jgi:hypothetical protein
MMRYSRASALCIGFVLAFLGFMAQVTPVQAVGTTNGIVTPSADTIVNGAVNGAVTVEGIAHHPGFRKWQLDLLIDGDQTRTRFIAVGEKMQPEPASLTILDTTRFPNGKHVLRLRVVYTGLQYDEFFTPIVIANANAPTTPAEEMTSADKSAAELRGAPEIIQLVDGVLGAGVPDGPRRVEVDISDQRLTAWQGDTIVLKTKVSTGKPGWRTLPGDFNVYVKYTQTRMVGPGYDTPDVPWTMYYYQGFAIHGAYWHNNFGTPVSHGCVNLPVDEAKLLFNWAEVGLEVVVVE